MAYDDYRVWARLYSPAGAVAVSTLSKKSVWRMQAEVLASVVDHIEQLRAIKSTDNDKGPQTPAGRSSGDSSGRPNGGRHRDSRSGGGGSHGPGGRGGRGGGGGDSDRSTGFHFAGLEFKKSVNEESDRIGTVVSPPITEVQKVKG